MYIDLNLKLVNQMIMKTILKMHKETQTNKSGGKKSIISKKGHRKLSVSVFDDTALGIASAGCRKLSVSRVDN